MDDKSRNNIMDEPVNVDAPILEPTKATFKPKSLMELALRSANLVNKRINNFANWILSIVPKAVKKKVNAGVELLKHQVKEIYKNLGKNQKRSKPSIRLTIRLREIALILLLRKGVYPYGLYGFPKKN